MKISIFISILFPILAGVLVLALRKKQKRSIRIASCVFAVSVSLFCSVCMLFEGDFDITLLKLSNGLSLSFSVDGLTNLFAITTNVLWLLVCVYSVEYMRHEQNEHIFYGFMLLTLGVMNGMFCSANLLTLYLFFELATLASMPLVLSSMKKEAIKAAQKYLYYSIGGAFLALFGIIVIYSRLDSLTFLSDLSRTKELDGLTLTAVFLTVLGFGTKAGMYPMHGWLPSAHPVAPSPASALLSGLIAESGVFAVIRVVKYTINPYALNGTWVQTVWLILALLTVFLGSMMACREKHIKKRLAFSSVSQISYIMTGLAVGTSVAFYGALLQYVFHAVIKILLFLCAGSIIMKTGKTNVEEYEGIGKDMPVTMWTYTIASLGLIGIPPTCGFVSKFQLCMGALLNSETLGNTLAYAVCIVLVVSALLTALYLLPIVTKGFFPKKDYVSVKRETSKSMYIPLIILAVSVLCAGIASQLI